MKRILAAIVVVGCAVLVMEWRVSAASNCSIPASWGPLRGAVYSTSTGAFNAAYLFFEASDGTIRRVREDNCKELGVITRN